MPVRVLLFASYADAIGASELEVPLRAGATVRDVVASVRERAGTDRLPDSPLVAVNQRYAKPDTPVGEHDEVAIIPPVAGG